MNDSALTLHNSGLALEACFRASSDLTCLDTLSPREFAYEETFLGVELRCSAQNIAPSV